MDIQAYTQRARAVIGAAQTDALTRDHQQILPAHIMQALLNESGQLPSKLLEIAGTNITALQKDIEDILAKQPRVEGGSGLSLSDL